MALHRPIARTVPHSRLQNHRENGLFHARPSFAIESPTFGCERRSERGSARRNGFADVTMRWLEPGACG